MKCPACVKGKMKIDYDYPTLDMIPVLYVWKCGYCNYSEYLTIKGKDK